jgi:hypothetical protein
LDEAEIEEEDDHLISQYLGEAEHEHPELRGEGKVQHDVFVMFNEMNVFRFNFITNFQVDIQGPGDGQHEHHNDGYTVDVPIQYEVILVGEYSQTGDRPQQN